MKKPIVLLSALFFGAGLLFAQSLSTAPGGVKAPEVWFKTVPYDQTDLNGSYEWKDFSGDKVYLTPALTGDNDLILERQEINTYNFNPALSFSGKNMNIELTKADLSQSTIIGLWGFKKQDSKKDGLLYNVNREEGQEFLLTKEAVEHAETSGRSQLEYEPNFTKQPEQNRISILTYCGGIRPNYSIWGRAKSSVINIGGVLAAAELSDKYAPGINKDDSQGYCPEFIVYNRVLTEVERLKVESYLAIKYGITINETYLNSKGDIIWDNKNEGTYKNRITGYMRDDDSGLNQLTSTSSYYDPSQKVIDDTYHDQNSNNKSARENLLVMGRQDKEEMINDGDFVIFGDNGQSTAIRNEDKDKEDYDYRRMQRVWKVKTNIQSSQLDYASAWTYDQTANVSYSNVPLKGDNGSFTLSCSPDRFGNYPSCILKFGSQSSELVEGASGYGYFMDARMRFFIVEKGKIGSVSLSTDHTQSRYEKVEICKEGNIIFLRVNSIRIAGSEITIDPTDLSKPFYGNLIGAGGISQHNGFVNSSGNVVELSGEMTEDSEFFDYARRNVYLLIDRTGTGNFDPMQTLYIRTDEFDPDRKKIIFNNVFWEDGDLFTFARSGYGYNGTYNSADFTITQTDPECVNNVAQNNGEIEIKFTGYYYSQFYFYTADGAISGDKSSDKITYDNTDNSYTVTGLPANTYNLVMSKYNDISFDFTATGDGAKATAQGNPLSKSYSVAWSILDPQVNATIAFASNSNLDTPLNGLKMSGGKLYAIANGVESEIKTLKAGDLLSFSIGDDGYGGTFPNGYLAIFAESVTNPGTVLPINYDAEHTLVVQVENGATIPNLSFGGDFTAANPLAIWQKTNMESVPVGVETREVVLSSGCPQQNVFLPPTTGGDCPEDVTNPSCGQSNATISLINGYNYQLINSVGTVLHSVDVHSNDRKLTDLAEGTYTLVRTSRNGSFDNFSFYGNSEGAYAIAEGAFQNSENNNFAIEWTVSNQNTDATVAMMLAYSRSTPVFNYGVRINGNKLYTIANSNESTTPVTINQGDRIRMERTGQVITVRIVNTNTLAGTLQIAQPDWYKNTFIAVRSFGSGISNLTAGNNFGFDSLNKPWETSLSMSVTSGSNSQVCTIELKEACAGLRSASTGFLSIYVHESGAKGFTAKLTLAKPEDATLSLYNSTGVLIAQKKQSASSASAGTDFTVPASGVYLVSAMTGSGKEYSSKVVIP